MRKGVRLKKKGRGEEMRERQGRSKNRGYVFERDKRNKLRPCDRERRKER